MSLRLLLAVICASLLVRASLSASQQEIKALNDFYSSTKGSSWTKNGNWTVGDPCLNSWYGVECDASMNVVSLVLSSNRLGGSLPDSISQLSNLKKLDLYMNGISGSILPSVGSLINLSYLDLSFNTFLGPVPSQLSSLTKLTLLNLYAAGLTGNLPDMFGGMKSLVKLNLSLNYLSGTIPASIFNLPPHSTIDLGDNQFTTIPWDKITNSSGLTSSSLFIVNNKISGSLSHQLYWPYYINLSLNKIEGTLPEYDPQKDTTRQSTLFISNNNLSGNIPESLAQNEGLVFLDVSNNTMMKGVIPEAFVNATSLSSLDFNNTRLTCPDSEEWQTFEARVATTCAFAPAPGDDSSDDDDDDDGFHIPAIVYVAVAAVFVVVIVVAAFFGYRYWKNRKVSADLVKI